ncbi:MAG: hypothetical protein HYX34_09250 [Actinobacteria bacterium]|nr:hypothetical protein [Actinomycetota bacterium]
MPTQLQAITDFFTERVPRDWFSAPCDVAADPHEILVEGALAEGQDPAEFRARTREQRMRIAAEAEATFARKVSWGVRCGDRRLRFTGLGVPVMTRLRFDERAVLDTLVDAGIARSRSEALAWCARLVGKHQADWITQLRDAHEAVRRIAEQGPEL